MARVAALLSALACAALAVAAEGPRRKLEGVAAPSFVPRGGKGSWASGGSTDIILIYTNLMKDGNIVGWSNGYGEFERYATVEYYTEGKKSKRILPDCGIHGCTRAFCAGVTTSAKDEIFVFGGHGLSNSERPLETAKLYDHRKGKLQQLDMPSRRWYPGAVTLPDGRVMVIGGVSKTAMAEYGSAKAYNNPSYTIFDPNTRKFIGDRFEMAEQLQRAFPIVAYPVVTVLPDGGLSVAAGNSLYKYNKCGASKYCKTWAYRPRPHVPWSYPQTGIGMPLPMQPPYNKLELLATGGSARDKADTKTPASNEAHVIDMTAGPRAPWRSVGPMPYPRVMGDAVYLCDGTIMFVNGAQRGRAGWFRGPFRYIYKDRKPWNCDRFCTGATGWLYEPVIFDPATGAWSRPGSLAEQRSLRLYHSTAILLPSCKVMIAGSDVTLGDYAEIFTPPYFNLGPAPTITRIPDSVRPGANLTLSYVSRDPIARAFLVRTGAHTHSTFFDARALWLTIDADDGIEFRRPVAGNTLTVVIPGCNGPRDCNILPPGMYMLTLNSDKGVPSAAKIISICPDC